MIYVLLILILAFQIINHFQNKKIMGQNEDFSAALDKLDADIQSVSDKLTAIINETPAGALTADQASALIARIQGEQTKLEGLAAPTPPATA